MGIQEVLNSSGIAFGTSGARGLVEDFTDDVCAAFTHAFLKVMGENFGVQRVALGCDLRPSSPSMVRACSAAAKALGVEVDNYGALPTPALALKAMLDGVPAIMVTGSHIPFDRNGIKFYRPDGEITKADELSIMATDGPLPSTVGIEVSDGVSLSAFDFYKDRYTKWFSGEPLSGWKVGLYQHSAVGRDLNQDVLETLGAEVIVLGRSESFVPVDTEAVSEEDKTRGAEWSSQYALDAILTTDGDGDRPLLADESGNWLRGDIVGLLCARELGIEALAVPVSCNTAIEACGAFAEVVRTRIGSPYVLAEMEPLTRRYERVAGFEANGGFLLGSAITQGERRLEPLPTRDALLPALTLMVAAANAGKTPSQLVNGLPERYTASDRLKDFPREKSLQLLAEWEQEWRVMVDSLSLGSDVEAVDITDGLRATLVSGEVVHLRPSGNAPELRCYAEAASESRASELVRRVLGGIQAV
jgi:phosphomannomutase